MKKILVLLALLILGVLAMTSLGCSGGLGIGWFPDDITGNELTFNGRLQILETTVQLPPPLDDFVGQPVNGRLKIVDTTDGVKIQVKSKLHRDDENTVNMYYIYKEVFSNDLHQLWSPDCKVNGVEGYQLLIEWLDSNASTSAQVWIRIGVYDEASIPGITEPVYYWDRVVLEGEEDLVYWRHVKVYE